MSTKLIERVTVEFLNNWVREMNALARSEADPALNSEMGEQVKGLVRAVNGSKLETILHNLIHNTVMPRMIKDEDPRPSIHITAIWGLCLGLRIAQKLIDTEELEKLAGLN